MGRRTDLALGGAAMMPVDVNVLLYAVNRSDPRHQKALHWWEEALDGDEPVGLCWPVIVGFLRIATNPRALPRPLSLDEAVERSGACLEHPNVQLVLESDEHWTILNELL